MDKGSRGLKRYRKIILMLLSLWAIWTFGICFLGGWFFNKSGLDIFPQINSDDRILILAPHIDDENIGASGIIQRALLKKAKVKVVYITNGDDFISSVIEENRSVKLVPEEFIKMGEERIREGEKAMSALGLNGKDLIFLGYPDRGLSSMLDKNYSSQTPFVSNGTKFNHNPYRQTYKPGTLYAGENLVADLNDIINEYKPTKIIVSHPRDKHSDHSAVFEFLQDSLQENWGKYRIYAYLVHFKDFPPTKLFQPGEYLYPPRRLFSREGWVSLELTKEEESKKLSAMKEYQSQESLVDNYGFLNSFVKVNEIFEEY